MTFHATNNFEGSIPQVIGKFKEFCGPNAFTRSIPSFIGNLQQLESLDLSSNNLRSEIPLQLANLNFLSFINISNNKLVVCDAGGYVIGLDLSGRSISSPIDNSNSFFRLQHLQRLNLDLDRFPAGFEKLENLSYLNLSEAGFTGQILIEISCLTRLVTLD
ncbi:receptor-like protein 12 [Gossypium australe]|uniref:Receptor-like protein 12 n=1 Tax=Gossypium australe TaxID=47621 RepID=A0A5B6V6Q4_9ROSI|nr:receptor-like protein 12 [Gossypium australe]